MALIPFPGTDQFTAITVSGLYDNNTESPLFAPSGSTVPTSGIAIGGSDANGLLQLLSLDQKANLLTFPGIQFVAGTAWTTATSGGTFQYNNGTTTEGPKTGAPAYVIQLDQTTTITGGAVTFQGTYDNINWVSIPVTQILDPSTFAQQSNPYTFTPSTNKAFLILAQGYAQVRLDLSTAITGTGSVTPYWTSLSYEPAIASSNSSTVSGTLSNNNAAPAANNVGVLPALAATSYTTNTYTTGNQVLPVTDLHGASNTDMQAVAGVQLGATGVTAFGTAPAAVAVQGVNASLYAGVTGLTATGTSLNTNVTNTVTVTGTVAVTQSTTPWVVAGSLTNNNAAPAANNVGVLPALANAAPPTYTEGDQVLISTNLSGAVRTVATGTTVVVGNLTNNNAAPTTTNVGVLNAIAVAGTFPAVTVQATTAGDQELLTVSQGGSLISIPADEEYASHISYYSVDTGATLKTVPNATVYPLISIRSSSAAIQYLVREVQGFTDGTQELIQLIKNPQTLTGSTFAATAPTGSHVTVDTAATAVTIGTGVVVWSGFASSAPAGISNILSSLAAGAPGDVYTVACQKFGTGTSKTGGQIFWSEVAAAI